MKSFSCLGALFGVVSFMGACTVNNLNNVVSDAGPGVDSSKPTALGFSPSNVDLSGMDLSKVGDYDITDSNCTIDSGSLQGTCGDPNGVLAFKLATQSDGTKVGVYVARTIRIEATAQLTVTGSFPIVLVALDQINILGRLIAAGKADVAICGGSTQTTANSKGGGLGGGGAGTSNAAGGGGSYCGVGGAGAVETAGPAAPGGTVFGSPQISPLIGGSSGGTSDTNGGAGGGAIQLVAANSLTIAPTGLIHVGGGGGGFGGAASTQEASGGGSGGAILLEAPVVTITGTLAANGGGGGEGALGNGGADASGDDQVALGGNDPTRGSNGGNGSAGPTLNGTAGADMMGSTAGGGGGGAGRIRINTTTGSATLAGAKLSPPSTSACATQGKLHP